MRVIIFFACRAVHSVFCTAKLLSFVKSKQAVRCIRVYNPNTAVNSETCRCRERCHRGRVYLCWEGHWGWGWCWVEWCVMGAFYVRCDRRYYTSSPRHSRRMRTLYVSVVGERGGFV